MQVDIYNSWLIDQLRSYAYPHDFKQYYHDRVLSIVFQQATLNDLGKELEINFIDNHYSNFDYLNYKELHKNLKKYFNTVTFFTDNIIDQQLDPEYFIFRYDEGILQDEVRLMQQIYQADDIRVWHDNKKLFGLYISRPDVHRFAILIEFHRRGLLKYTDCRLGFDRADLMADEHWRASGIDLACKIMDMPHQELLLIIDSIGKNGRDYKNRTDEVSDTDTGKPTLILDHEKSVLNNNFVIDIMCHSTTTNNIFGMTEKMERLFALGQPFIFIGPANFYKNVKKFGIKTYSDFWDESWDSIPHEQLSEKIIQIASVCEYIANTYTAKEVFYKTMDIGNSNSTALTNDLTLYGSEDHRTKQIKIKLATTYDDE